MFLTSPWKLEQKCMSMNRAHLGTRLKFVGEFEVWRGLTRVLYFGSLNLVSPFIVNYSEVLTKPSSHRHGFGEPRVVSWSWFGSDSYNSLDATRISSVISISKTSHFCKLAWSHEPKKIRPLKQARKPKTKQYKCLKPFGTRNCQNEILGQDIWDSKEYQSLDFLLKATSIQVL
jgi:hypothetical protein